MSDESHVFLMLSLTHNLCEYVSMIVLGMYFGQFLWCVATIDPSKRRDFQACESCQHRFLCHLATCAAASCILYQ